MNAEQKKVIALSVILTGVIVGVNLAKNPISKLASKVKWKFSKYPLIWDVILKGEAKTYNDYNFYNSKGLNSRINAKNTLPFSEKLLTQMSVGKVMEYQSLPRTGIGQLFATGGFQIIPDTLKGMYGKAGLNLTSIYNEENQTKIGDALINERTNLRKYLNKEIEDTDTNLKRASLDIAKIWSSVGVPYDVVNHKGQSRKFNTSFYALDKASTDTAKVQEILRKQRNA